VTSLNLSVQASWKGWIFLLSEQSNGAHVPQTHDQLEVKVSIVWPSKYTLFKIKLTGALMCPIQDTYFTFITVVADNYLPTRLMFMLSLKPCLTNTTMFIIFVAIPKKLIMPKRPTPVVIWIIFLTLYGMKSTRLSAEIIHSFEVVVSIIFKTQGKTCVFVFQFASSRWKCFFFKAISVYVTCDVFWILIFYSRIHITDSILIYVLISSFTFWFILYVFKYTALPMWSDAKEQH
jgi:hypothetical protein